MYNAIYNAKRMTGKEFGAKSMHDYCIQKVFGENDISVIQR